MSEEVVEEEVYKILINLAKSFGVDLSTTDSRWVYLYIYKNIFRPTIRRFVRCRMHESVIEAPNDEEYSISQHKEMYRA